MSIIIFIVILAILVFVHELGHFSIAKKLGILVHEFAIGFPPRIISKKIGETKYSINIIPFGGYVKIEGEDSPKEDGQEHLIERSMYFRPAWQKISVLSAGVLSNIILAWVLISVSLSSGMTSSISEKNEMYAKNSRVMITGVQNDSPAKEVKVEAGESIVSVSTKTEEKITLSSPEALRDLVAKSEGSPIILHTKSIKGEEKNYIINPVKNTETGDYKIGISMDFVGEVDLPFWKAPIEGAKMTVFIVYDTVVGFGKLIGGIFTGGADLSQVSGPIGIAGLVGEARELGIAYLLSFTAFISINLAVLNLIPFPALDGGRILFVIIEKIKKSPIQPNIANTVNAIGFGLLMILMVVITVRDLMKIF